jgi:hypothetical protein
MHVAHVALDVSRVRFGGEGGFAICFLVGLWSHFSNLASASSPDHLKKKSTQHGNP